MRPGDIRFLASLAALATALLLAAILFHIWKVIMPKLIRLLSAALAFVALLALFLAPWLAREHPLAGWGLICGFLVLAALAVAWDALGRWLRVLVLTAVLPALVACSGVRSFLAEPTPPGGTMGQAILQHIELCDRLYRGAIGAGVTGSFDISCKASPVVVPLKDAAKVLTPADPPL